jgi:hypothetical protein
MLDDPNLYIGFVVGALVTAGCVKLWRFLERENFGLGL